MFALFTVDHKEALLLLLR